MSRAYIGIMKTQSKTRNNSALLVPVCLTIIGAACYYTYSAVQTYLANTDAYADHDVMVHFQSNIGLAVMAATISGLILLTVLKGNNRKA